MVVIKATSPRVSRMAVRACLSCAEHTLVSNGGFWACQFCGFAVTSLALTKDLQQIAMLEESALVEQEDAALTEASCRLAQVSLAASRG